MRMLNGTQLDADRCPHCRIAKPLLTQQFVKQSGKALWQLFVCSSCAGMVLTKTLVPAGGISEVWPASLSVSEDIPKRPREYLAQAAASLHAPAGAMMLTASAVDAMLQDKGYKEGSLYSRVKEASTKHLITREMADWAHEVRLEANDQRHADESAALPVLADAERSLEFALALAQFIYVLPARVARGRDLKKEADKK